MRNQKGSGKKAGTASGFDFKASQRENTKNNKKSKVSPKIILKLYPIQNKLK